MKYAIYRCFACGSDKISLPHGLWQISSETYVLSWVSMYSLHVTNFLDFLPQIGSKRLALSRCEAPARLIERRNRQCGKIYHNFCHINNERKIAMRNLNSTEAPRRRIRFVDNAYRGLFTNLKKKYYHESSGDGLSIWMKCLKDNIREYGFIVDYPVNIKLSMIRCGITCYCLFDIW